MGSFVHSDETAEPYQILPLRIARIDLVNIGAVLTFQELSLVSRNASIALIENAEFAGIVRIVGLGYRCRLCR